MSALECEAHYKEKGKGSRERNVVGSGVVVVVASLDVALM
jgi:hypothetical protein